MQVYDTLRIGTARPSEQEMQGVPHHLMGVVPLNEPYHVARYTGEAHEAIRPTDVRRTPEAMEDSETMWNRPALAVLSSSGA